MSKPLNKNTSLQWSASVSWAASLHGGTRCILPLEADPCSALAPPLPQVCPTSMVVTHTRLAIIATVRPQSAALGTPLCYAIPNFLVPSKRRRDTEAPVCGGSCWAGAGGGAAG